VSPCASQASLISRATPTASFTVSGSGNSRSPAFPSGQTHSVEAASANPAWSRSLAFRPLPQDLFSRPVSDIIRYTYPSLSALTGAYAPQDLCLRVLCHMMSRNTSRCRETPLVLLLLTLVGMESEKLSLARQKKLGIWPLKWSESAAFRAAGGASSSGSAPGGLSPGGAGSAEGPVASAGAPLSKTPGAASPGTGVTGSGSRTPPLGLRSESAGLRSESAGLRSESAGLRSESAGLRSESAGLRSESAERLACEEGVAWRAGNGIGPRRCAGVRVVSTVKRPQPCARARYRQNPRWPGRRIARGNWKNVRHVVSFFE
jgi:hypothetical protein